MADFVPGKPDHEGLQPVFDDRAGHGLDAPEPVYDLDAGDGVNAPQVLYDRTEFKEINVPNMEERSSRTALVMDAKSSEGYYASTMDGSTLRSSGCRPDSDPRSNEYYGEKASGWQQRRPWYRRWWILTLIVLIFLILVTAAITIPLVIVRKSNGGKPLIGPNGAKPSSTSTRGALAGTGIGAGDFGDPTIVYFQHFDGDLWETSAGVGGRDFVGKVLESGSLRNATPLAAISYLWSDERFYRHVVYLDPKNVVRDIFQIQGSGSWKQGGLGPAGFRASSSPTVGLSFIGLQTDDRAVSNFPMGSLRVYHGGEDGRIHELTLKGGEKEWKETFIFPEKANGNGGIYVGQPWDVSNLICTSTSNELIFFSQSSRPIEQGPWQERQGSGIDVMPGSGVGLVLDYAVFYQDPRNVIHAIDFQPNNTESSPWLVPHFVDEAIPGTRLVGMSVSWDTTPSVIYQTDRENLTQSIGTTGRGIDTWTQNKVQVDH